MPCPTRPMVNGRCRMHGGKSLGGLASPTLITGRYSKHLPTRLLSGYQEAIADPDLLALRDDIGLLDTRVAQVVSALDTGESRESWSLLSSLWTELETGWKDMPPDDMERTIERVGKIMRDGLSAGYVWSEIRGLLKERADLVANERKRLVELQQYVTSERALLFVQAVMASVKQHVGDRTALAAIAADLARLSDVRDGRELAGAAGAAG